jgi:hypothetical protein
MANWLHQPGQKPFGWQCLSGNTTLIRPSAAGNEQPWQIGNLLGLIAAMSMAIDLIITTAMANWQQERLCGNKLRIHI